MLHIKNKWKMTDEIVSALRKTDVTNWLLLSVILTSKKEKQ